MFNCIGPLDQHRPRLPQTSSPNHQMNGRIFHTNMTSGTWRHVNPNVSAIGPVEDVHNTSIDSVFAALPPTYDSCEKKSKEPVMPVSMSVEGAPVRVKLYSDGGVAVCRICQSSEKSCPYSNGEPLISLCNCCGSTGLYHRTCLERWLTVSSKDKCEICQFQYRTERIPKTLMDFIRNPGSKTTRRHWIIDIIIWFILTPTAAVGTWFCVLGAINRTSPTNKEKDKDYFADRGEGSAILIAVAGFLLITYLVWAVVCIRYHVGIYRRWQLRNFRIRLVLPTDKKTERGKSEGDSDSDRNAHIEEGQLTQVSSPMQEADGTADDHGNQRSDVDGTPYSTPWPSRHRYGLQTHPTPGHDMTAGCGPRTGIDTVEVGV